MKPERIVPAVPGPGQESVWDYPRPPRIEPSTEHVVVLLGGIAAVLLAFGKFDYLGWVTRGHHVHPQVIPGHASRGQRALVKFFAVVALLFLMQTLVGGGVAHYRADPSSFYGFQLERIFPCERLPRSALFWLLSAV